MFGGELLKVFLASLKPPERVLDIGGGREGSELEQIEEAGHEVRVWDVASGDGLYGPNGMGQFDAVYCSHTLEHMRNPGLSLEAMYANLKTGGLLGIAVPPRKDEIVDGHVTLWNAGLLLYQMVLAGFDCSDAGVKTEGYNCMVLVRKHKAGFSPQALTYHTGDLQRLSAYFPFRIKSPFQGVIKEHNWGPKRGFA